MADPKQNESTTIAKHLDGIRPRKTEIQGHTLAHMLGEVTWLYSNSKIHRDWPFASLQQWILPAFQTKQFRIFRDGLEPKAFVAWAWMSEEAEQLYVQNTGNLRPEHWTSGKLGWIVDLCTTEGSGKQVFRFLRNELFVNDVGRALRVRPGSDTGQIIYMHGAKAVEKSRDPNEAPTVKIEPSDDVGDGE